MNFERSRIVRAWRVRATFAAVALTLGVGGDALASTLEWFPAQTLSPSTPTTTGNYGISVALAGGTAVVGAVNAWNDPTPGAVYVYVQSGSGTPFSLQQKLVSSDPDAGPLFGTSVAIEGDTILVGAPGADGTGAAYVFTRSGTVWSEQQKLVQPSGNANTAFGQSTALSVDTAFVGNWEISFDNNVHIGGGVYVYARSTGAWSTPQLVQPADETFEDGTAQMLAVSGGTLVTGALNRNVAYVLSESGASWGVQQELTPNDSAGQLGEYVAVSGSTLVLSSSGKAYVYAASGATWSVQQEIANPNGPVAISGTTLLVGGGSLTRAFVQSGTTWTEQPTQLPAAESLALDGTTGLLGASSIGVAYICTQGPANGATCAVASDCGSGNCVSGVCCATTCGPCGDCSTGTCTPLAAGATGVPTCAPFACNGASAVCPVACATDADCTAGDYCPGPSSLDGGADADAEAAGDAGTPICASKKPLGASCVADHECTSGSCVDMACRGTKGPAIACTADDECASDHCADGVCCDRACSGQCEACDEGTPGTCSPVTGPPRGGRPACAGANTPCAGTCNGVASTTACQYTSATACGTACAVGLLTTSTCDGTGRCIAGTAEQCPGNFACGTAGDACRTTCTVSADCAAGFACQGGACVPAAATCVGPHTSQSAVVSGDAGTSECAPYLCDPAGGTCRTSCVSAADCVSPDVCDTTGHCVPIPSTNNDAGCACRQATGAPSASPWAALGLAACGLAASSARRRRRAASGEGRRAG